ncbi:uncharacterized protein LOC105701125 [Orussus abietinus]|uniref:uncharacterized protein LOC105701125 n=1 Tax=Orussus abietinus TaxID=222816 RepID=UPI000C715C49|nr:uncharacterized protein LOC105701125 [Orussus abietinus]
MGRCCYYCWRTYCSCKYLGTTYVPELEEERRKAQLREMLESYSPWGKPGGGAPYAPALRRKNVWLESEEHQRYCSICQARKHCGRLYCTCWRRPFRCYSFDDLYLYPGIGFADGFGSQCVAINDRPLWLHPRRYPGGQASQESRTGARQESRDRTEIGKNCPSVLRTLAQPSPFGRPGPGGVPWRDPKLLGVRFLQSMGWTGKSMAGRLHARDVDPLPITETNRFFDDKSGHGAVSDVYPRGTELQARSPRCRNMHNEEVQVYELTGGVELVPLMTTRRYQSQPQTTRFLATDATRPGYTIEALRALGTGNKEYISALAEQIRGKRERIMEEERKERESCRRHFDTWRGFWGRPGHGAPLDHTQRVKLYDILYRPPIVY